MKPGTMVADMHDHPGHRFDPHNMHKLEDPEREKWFPVDTIFDWLQVRPGMHVVDVGAGAGFFAIPLARRVAPGGKIIAVDAQPEMLEYLRRKLDAASVTMDLVQAEAEHLPLQDASAEVVFMANVWHELDDREAAALEARRVLRPGGKLAVLDWRPDCPSPPGPPVEHRIGAVDARKELSSLGFTGPEAVNIGPYSYLVLGVRSGA